MKFSEFDKLREREAPTFANINLLGPCNVDCYFCLGKDIDSVWSKQNQIKTHFSMWDNFDEFLVKCEDSGIKNIYLTGQNTDSLLYKYFDELVDYIQDARGFDMGIRTNGYLAHKHLETINKLRRSCGFSIHTLDPETNKKIMNRADLPNWDNLLSDVKQSRVSIVLNRHNVSELYDLLDYITLFKNVKYVQVRRICTDTREDWLIDDVKAYESSFERFDECFDETRKFYGAECYDYNSKEITWWRTVKTSIGSFNYYTDGSYTDDYFVIEGYQNNGLNYPKRNEAVIPLEGFWRKAR